MSEAMRIFDRHLLRHRRERAAATVDQVRPVLEDAADRLLDRLEDTTLRFSRALDIGGRGFVAPLLRARGVEFVTSMDLAPAMATRAGGLPLVGDEEWLPFAPGSFDLVVASLSLHWVNDLPGALVQIRKAMKPNGLFLASLPGLPTLMELREALQAAETGLRGGISPRVSPFPELRDGASLLQRAGFALPVADAEDIDLRYRTPLGLLKDLRAAGEGNAVLARDGRVPPRDFFPAAMAMLPEGEDGYPATFRLMIMTGWGPDAVTQSKPARPGSATVRLADALGTEERPAGEKPRP